MTMITIKGNILAVKQGFICHQINCQGVMGSGLAKDIKTLWPKVLGDYMGAYRKGQLTLGQVIFTTIKIGHLYIASMCGQDHSGASGRHTDYPALGQCLQTVEAWYKTVGESKLPVYIPYEVGCGLEGGQWSVVKTIIKRELPKAIIIKSQSHKE